MQVKPVKGYEGLYEVSEDGDVYRKKSGRRLKPGTDAHGYLLVGLCKDGIPKTKKVHRIVAEAFLDNPEDKPEINHKDFNPKNNKISNLEWCTPQENVAHYNKFGNNPQRRPIEGVNESTGEIIKFPSIAEAVRNGFNGMRLHLCCKHPIRRNHKGEPKEHGPRNTHKGYSWGYCISDTY